MNRHLVRPHPLAPAFPDTDEDYARSLKNAIHGTRAVVEDRDGDFLYVDPKAATSVKLYCASHRVVPLSNEQPTQAQNVYEYLLHGIKKPLTFRMEALCAAPSDVVLSDQSGKIAYRPRSAQQR